MNDPYSTLGVSKTATDAEIKSAYRRLAKQCHPDAGGDETKFADVNNAYNMIKDAASRQNFENQRFDLYANLMQMHWSNDPYSDFSEKVKLIKPKGQFFCCLFGAETLSELRDSFSKAEMELFGVTSPRISPLPEIRDVGNLAAKVGLNNSVVDRDIIKVGYKSIEDLFSDLKKMGETNAILGRKKGLTTKKLIHEVEKFYFKNHSDKKLGENVTSIRATFEVIFLYGTK